MRPHRLVLALSGLVVLLAASPAEARRGGTRVALGLGADYVLDPEIGEFQLTLALETPIARGLTAGAKFGALMTSKEDVGAPIDFRLRLRTHGLYVDGLVGPWIFFDGGDALELHAGFGFGLISGGTSFGLEVGWLDGSGMVGLRLAFSL